VSPRPLLLLLDTHTGLHANRSLSYAVLGGPPGPSHSLTAECTEHTERQTKGSQNQGKYREQAFSPTSLIRRDITTAATHRSRVPLPPATRNASLRSC
jgi:hypothetical protein